MLLTLYIRKAQPGLYTSHVADGSVDADSFDTATIAEALRSTAANAYDAAGFNVYYHDVSIGTVSICHLASDSEALADRLVDLASSFRD